MAQKTKAEHAERILKDASLEISPGGQLICITFIDGSKLTILTERSCNVDEEDQKI
jgi:hypothetical protein